MVYIKWNDIKMKCNISLVENFLLLWSVLIVPDPKSRSLKSKRVDN